MWISMRNQRFFLSDLGRGFQWKFRNLDLDESWRDIWKEIDGRENRTVGVNHLQERIFEVNILRMDFIIKFYNG
ncbi:hypothetical protein RIR_jg27962.t2 [Rhizophagus irregularis DAOM 181602=DAOM 197198]|nr:hypothetical protein RIR_jg27962.t2 [Rhizophagus irregularis DAOM 181602=DAOM 197198]